MDYNGLTLMMTRHPTSPSTIRATNQLNPTAVMIELAGRVMVQSPYTAPTEHLLYGSQARIAFAMLVLERNRPLLRQELAEALWSDGLPRTWGVALRGVVSKVRGFMTAAGMRENAPTYDGFGAYQLKLSADMVVDIEFATFAVETAEQMLHGGNLTSAIRFAEHAHSVAVRPFLPEANGWWVDGVRFRLREILLWSLCVLGESHIQSGRPQLAVQVAEQATGLEPFRERNYQLLIRAHAAAGNPAEALRVYERVRRLLADELGVQPAIGTAALHRMLLRNEL
jgi:DNA-binding SARP family transcriptional activator